MDDNSTKMKWMSTSQVAQRLGVSRMEVVRKIKRGELSAHKVGRSYMIKEGSLPGIHRSITESEKKNVEQAVEQVIQQYGDVIRRLGHE